MDNLHPRLNMAIKKKSRRSRYRFEDPKSPRLQAFKTSNNWKKGFAGRGKKKYWWQKKPDFSGLEKFAKGMRVAKQVFKDVAAQRKKMQRRR